VLLRGEKMNTWPEHIEKCTKCGAIVGVVFALCEVCHHKRLKWMASMPENARERTLRRQLEDDDSGMNTETMSGESKRYLWREVADFKKTLKKA